MKLTRYTNNNREIDTAQFDFIIEVAAWADTGTTEYVGIAGTPSQDELIALLSNEVEELHKWFDEEVCKGNLEERTNEPQIARILQRPEADEDGEYPASCDWPVYI
jgi:hypothetical protein